MPAFLILSACLINQDLYQQRKAELEDADGDGFNIDQGDCDDADATVFPGADERCDGVDEDCDGVVDEDPVDAPSWFPDVDGDGFGGDGLAVSGCAAPEGYVNNALDCDDADTAVYPGAIEIWYDGVDTDCDGRSDFDADGDGYDSDRYGGLDCDDDEPAVYPGADEGWTDLGVDNDCDGSLDDQVSPVLAALGAIAGEGEGGAFGEELLVLPAGWAAETATAIISASATDDYAGATFAWEQQNLSDARSPSDSDWAIDGEGYFGYRLGLAGDAEQPVLLASAVTAEVNRGAVVGWTGGAIGSGLDAASFRIVGDQEGIFVGGSLLRQVDLDGDGLNDLVTSAILDSRVVANAGSVAVFFDPGSLAGELGYDDADVLFTTTLAGASLSAVGVGDVDGSGVAGLGFRMSSAGSDPEGAMVGEVPRTGVHDLDEAADATFYACTPARATDLDGDGSPELIALGGGVYQFDLPVSGSVTPWDQAISASGFVDPATSWASAFDDQIPYWSGRRAMTTSYVHDGERGAVALYALQYGRTSVYDDDAMLFVLGERAGDRLGQGAAPIDWDLDGVDDLLIGAPGADTTTTDAGRVYLVPAPR